MCRRGLTWAVVLALLLSLAIASKQEKDVDKELEEIEALIALQKRRMELLKMKKGDSEPMGESSGQGTRCAGGVCERIQRDDNPEEEEEEESEPQNSRRSHEPPSGDFVTNYGGMLSFRAILKLGDLKPVAFDFLSQMHDHGHAKFVAVADSEGTLHFYERTGKRVSQVSTPHKAPIVALKAHAIPRYTLIATADTSGQIYVHSFTAANRHGMEPKVFVMDQREVPDAPAAQKDIVNLAWVSHQRLFHLVAADVTGSLRMYNRNGTFVSVVNGTTDDDTAVAVAPSSGLILAGNSHGLFAMDVKEKRMAKIVCVQPPVEKGGLPTNWTLDVADVVFDVQHSTMAYVLTTDGTIVVALVRSGRPYKCTVKHSFSLERNHGPVAATKLATIKGYLVVVSPLHVAAYNLSVMTRVNQPELCMGGVPSEVWNQPAKDANLPHLRSDGNQQIAFLTLGGSLAVAESHLPPPPPRDNSQMTRHPVFLIGVALVFVWQFFRYKKKNSAGAGGGPGDKGFAEMEKLLGGKGGGAFGAAGGGVGGKGGGISGDAEIEALIERFSKEKARGSTAGAAGGAGGFGGGGAGGGGFGGGGGGRYGGGDDSDGY